MPRVPRFNGFLYVTLWHPFIRKSRSWTDAPTSPFQRVPLRHALASIHTKVTYMASMYRIPCLNAFLYVTLWHPLIRKSRSWTDAPNSPFQRVPLRHALISIHTKVTYMASMSRIPRLNAFLYVKIWHPLVQKSRTWPQCPGFSVSTHSFRSSFGIHSYESHVHGPDARDYPFQRVPLHHALSSIRKKVTYLAPISRILRFNAFRYVKLWHPFVRKSRTWPR